MTSHYHQLPRRRQHDIDYDHEPLPPPASSSLRLSQEDTMMMAPPPLGPLVEPNYQTKLILGDMFSQQATLRNYSPESIQAIMMALDEQKRETQQQLLDEEASLALARQLMVQEAEQHPPVSRLSLISSDLDADDWSGEAEEEEDDENHHGGEQYQGYRNNEYYNDFHCSSVAPRISMQSLEEQHVDSIMPMPMPMSMSMPGLQSSLLIEEDDDEDKKLKGKSSSIGSSNASTSSSEGTNDRKSAHFVMERVPKAAFVAPPTSGDRAHHWQHQQQEQQAEEQRAGRPPKKKASGTTTTTTKKKKKKKDRQCLICHRSTAECRLRMRKLACGHHFCRSCIDRWLTAQGKDTCPYCRKKVSEETRRKVQRQNSISPPSA